MGVLRLRHGREFIDAVCRILVEVPPQRRFAAAVSVVNLDLAHFGLQGLHACLCGPGQPDCQSAEHPGLLFGLGVTLATPPAAAVSSQ